MSESNEVTNILNVIFPPEISNLITSKINYHHQPNKDCKCNCTRYVSKNISKHIMKLVVKRQLRQNKNFINNIHKTLDRPWEASTLLNEFSGTESIIESIEDWGRCSCCAYHSNLSNIGMKYKQFQKYM